MHWIFKGWNGFASLYFIYSATIGGRFIISHWCIHKLPVFIAEYVSKWYMKHNVYSSALPNHNYISDKPLSTSNGIGGVKITAGVTMIIDEKPHIVPFFLSLLLGNWTPWLAESLLEVVLLVCYTGRLSTSRDKWIEQGLTCCDGGSGVKVLFGL